MSLAVSFRAAARAELVEAAAWYEAQRPGLGAEFITEIERCTAQASEAPEFYPVVYKNLRRAVVRRFPYSIYFRAESARIVVLAVFHGSRDPMIWPQRR
ncbi:MAG: type II toxin-antitoxin system RelE/ParE family toxin [Gammaproteobacteria bacterium]